MLARVLRTAAVLACLLAAASAQQAAQQAAPLQAQQVPLEPFVEVDICLPVSVLIKPDAAANAGYSIALEAEQAVLSALSYNVTDSVLLLGSTADFVTSRPIKVTVTMPAGALQAVNHQGTGAEVFVAPGFTLPSFVASTSFGAGRLFVDGMVAQNATLLLSGTGDAVLQGSFGSVTATSTGTGGLYISGVNDTARLDLRGVSNAFVQPALPTTAITGTAQGINTYTDGTCQMQSGFTFLQICQLVPFIATPAANPVWTCGLQVQGSFQCSDQGAAFTSRGGFVGTSGAEGTVPVTTTTPNGVSAFTPSSFQFAGASPAGPGTGTQQQAGAVTPGGTTASSNVAGTGSVGATSVAGPGGATTSTTQNGASTGFQTTGQQTSGSGTAAGMGTGTAGQPAAGGTSPGVIRTGADGQSQATATSQACVAMAPELRMPLRGAD
ncbi:hypothetical protein CHLNCDRAFT_136105 [Chlorella variabilis]|uniref:Putative auto-transporter adhesin head GIN domain-containing protein n=1 Tax=Chlorella variabilis TaxID=554065 RepID=E1ZJR7_CHLVA|nr:hypothetical protein CHLNCDRAFT_136105 [Chlorella variabilis]EFN53910.1 hypothetical protein CHLNCDRAFT_136105 [Chlorella variabilis]|eukprot:XP_005846012.1 hypothetical protein CHLNCDRAFT_136105 [Chlorella variabilis]